MAHSMCMYTDEQNLNIHVHACMYMYTDLVPMQSWIAALGS